MGTEITTFLVGVALPVAGIAKAWIGYRKVVAMEQWRTRRLEVALRLVGPEHRAEVVAASAKAEVGPHLQRLGREP